MDGPRGSSNSPPPFLIKTYEMVDDPTTNSIVSWSPTNTSFVVWNQPEFARDLLPKYFKHNNFSSFVRQLNTYGFRKIDPEQWEFANEDFVRGQKHLLKNIHRRKPVHSHSLQIQGNSSVPLSEAERQELEEEIERLKQEKVSLVNELKKHAQQQQHGMEQQMESLEKRLQVIENRQRCLMAFLTQIIQGPGFLSNLVQHSDLHSKKRRLPKIDYFNEDTSMEDNQIVAFQPMATGTSDIVSMHTLDMEPFEKMESSLNSLEKFFRGVSEAAGDDMSYDSTVPCLPSDIILPEMNASSGDIDANLESLLPNLRPSSSCHRDIHSSPEVAECTSYVETPAIPAMENQTDSSSKVSETDANPKLLLPNLHPSSPCLRDIHSSPEVAECTSYVETPAIAATENQTDSRSKVSEIDMNIEPAATEVDSSRDQTTGTTASTVPAGVNDVFWEQFLTEIPGSSDMQEVQSKRRDSDDKQSEGKKGEWENTWWKWKKVYHLAEKMGNLTSVEKI